MKPNLIPFVALAALVLAGCAGTGGPSQVAEDDIAGRALIAAAEQGRSDVARFAIEQGADVDVRDSYGFTPLHEAAEQGHLEVVAHLVKHGADPKIGLIRGYDNYPVGATPLDIARAAGRRICRGFSGLDSGRSSTAELG